MFCGNCGNEIKEGEKFCSSCGTPVPAEESMKGTAKTAEGSAQKIAAAKEQSVDETIAVPKKKKGKGGLIALILVLAIVAAGGISAVYFTSDEYKIGKNEKLAKECIDAQDYKGALGYYKEILKLDDLREDVYLSAAEAYLELEKTDKALDMLQDGLKACKKDENATAMLIGKQVEIYQKQIDDYLATGDYDKAFSLIGEAYAATNAAEILTRKTEVYKVESDAYANAGDFASARDILLRGIEETGDETLRAGITTVYLKEADAAIQGANYEGAESVLWEGISTTGDGDGNLLAKVADIYRLKSDAALVAGDCVYGVQLLVNGAEITGNTALIERADYVKQNVIALPGKIWSGSGRNGVIYTCEYDDANRLIRKTGEDMWGNATGNGITYEYDDSGHLIKSYGSRSTSTYEYEFDAAGNIVKEYIRQDNSSDTRVREYNEVGKLVRSYRIAGDSGNIERDYHYEYDSSGILCKRTLDYGDGYNYYEETEWDVNGNVTRTYSQSSSQYGGWPCESTYEYEYDGVRCVNVTVTTVINYGNEEYDTVDFYEYEFVYDGIGRVSSIMEGDSYWYGAHTHDYTYNEAEHSFSVSNADDNMGYYQPLEGVMNYRYGTVYTSWNEYMPSYSMYTYDYFGNKIYSAACFSAYDSEDVILNYIYHYIGD